MTKLESENRRLVDRLKLPESDQKDLKDQEAEIVALHKKVATLQQELLDMDEDNVNLRKEITGECVCVCVCVCVCGGGVRAGGCVCGVDVCVQVWLCACRFGRARAGVSVSECVHVWCGTEVCV